VACLGLFGLVSFATTQRTKEIGVRKILGAHTWHILALLSKDFLGLILIANLIAWPLTYWGMSRWLEGYAFKILITPLLFVLPTLAVLGIAVLTIVLHTRKPPGPTRWNRCGTNKPRKPNRYVLISQGIAGKYLRGDCTPQEADRVLDWLSTPEGEHP
jgi:hypothetical protein